MRFLIPLLLALALTACGDVIRGAPGELAMAEGLWGWENGAGCEGRTHAVLIEGDVLSFYEAGEVTARARLANRELIYSERSPGVRHRLEQVEWTYSFFDENREVIGRREVFYVDYLSYGLKYLNHWERYETEPGGTAYTRVRDFPTRRNHLRPCATE